MTSLIVIVECTVLITLVILLMGFLYKNQSNDRKTKLFMWCLITAILSLIFDAASYILDGYPGIYVLQFIINLLAVLSGTIVIIVFILYEIELFSITKKLSKWYIYSGLIYTLAVDIALIVLMFTGDLFTVENNVFLVGDAYDLYVASQVIAALYLIFIAVFNHKNVEKRDLMALLFYLLLPIINAIIELCIPGFGLSYAAAGISLLIVYVLLQSDKVEDSRIREELLKEYGYNDPLTGLPNRRAYDILLDSEIETSIGVIFCDLNGLKYTNDLYGHKAGDELIVKFSDMLKKQFETENSYRISGDEFVIVLKNIEAEEFFNTVGEFRKENDQLKKIASIGQIYGDGNDLNQLIIEAEDLMYKEKEIFHKENPNLSR